MDLLTSFLHREEKLLAGLREHKTAFDDPNGKGDSTETIVERALIRPFLRPDFDCGKGTVVERPDKQSPAIDRVIWSRRDCPPLVYTSGHSLFPVECVVGGVEVTMALDARKLRTDMQRLAVLRGMRQVGIMTSVKGSATKVKLARGQRKIECRAYIIGYPSDPTWKPQTIADTFFQLQQELKVLVHGLYVLGIGYFHTESPERGSKQPVRIIAYQGYDRLFRFTTTFRTAMDRWDGLGKGRAYFVGDYLADSGTVLVTGDKAAGG